MTDRHIPTICQGYVLFYGSVFSNWYTTPNQLVDHVNGFVFNNTEAAFMYRKALLFGDGDTAAKIIAHAEANGHPREVKAMGREIKGYDEAEWECVREGEMALVNLWKYRQNPELAEQLKATAPRTLVEASPTDRIWGVGLSVDDAVRHIELGAIMGGWPGRNLLGEALITVRSLL